MYIYQKYHIEFKKKGKANAFSEKIIGKQYKLYNRPKQKER